MTQTPWQLPAPTQTAIACDVMRGGTSKGLVFDRADLPTGRAERDAVLLAAMGSPDEREIDGMGGAHPLTSKVAVVSRSARPDADVDYLFLQVWPDRPEVSDSQNCGNMLAAVGPFAIEHGMVEARDGLTPVRIWMQNTDTLATAHVRTPGGAVHYDGEAAIDGVPGRHAPIPLEFADTAGSSCGALLPTGNVVDEIAGLSVTCIDNGMPVVCLAAADFGLSGTETPAELEAMTDVLERIEQVRLAAGPLMKLGDVTAKTVPKMSLLSAATAGGTVSTRTLIPHRVHEAIGVLGAVSVATACLLPGSVAEAVAQAPEPDGTADGPVDGVLDVVVEHPTGFFTVSLDVDRSQNPPEVRRSALLRTARLLMRGHVMVPAATWSAGATG
ncbi:4-oxalomesaconate tautomerase [Jatrophihabitans telluris]|uniref:4-oxalomesaconate tautomerase n=1 Tax=Jatrophihabitans telluris TaxID=2038343 RepID=A0ABY4QVH2_9ACTN|nr:4-oxalomesaconate tautomerase [Jatrophihabitans telluris]UQX87428.1 4-oxalomesaconate tautomerase [Jatrophihabitans telluris]